MRPRPYRFDPWRVRRGAVLAGAGVVALAVSARAEDPPATVTEALARLREQPRVGGDSVGYDGTPTAFFTISRTLLSADEATRRELLDDANPIARAMGLFLAVETKGKEAVPILRAHLVDRARFDCFPAGCCGWQVSGGAVARAFLENRHYLRYGKEPEPLVDARTRLAFDLEALADNRAAVLHDDLRRAITKAVDEHILGLTWADLRRVGATANLSDATMVKAVGRLDSDGSRAFLVAAVRDPATGADARLAAASALTRTTDDESGEAIRTAGALIDAGARDSLAHALLQTMEARRTWIERQPGALADHPLAIPDLVSVLRESDMKTAMTSSSRPAQVPRELRPALMDSLVRIATGLRTPAPAWDTYGSALYVLESLAVPAWGTKRERDFSDEPLTKDERARLLEALRPHLAAK